MSEYKTVRLIIDEDRKGEPVALVRTETTNAGGEKWEVYCRNRECNYRKTPRIEGLCSPEGTWSRDVTGQKDIAIELARQQNLPFGVDNRAAARRIAERKIFLGIRDF